MTPPRRHWLRFAFSLRTLFILVTAFACWLGYQVNWIRQRHAYCAERHVWTDNYIVRRPGSPPGSLGLFGETGFRFMSYESKLGLAEKNRVQAIFPEAWLFDRAAPDF